MAHDANCSCERCTKSKRETLDVVEGLWYVAGYDRKGCKQALARQGGGSVLYAPNGTKAAEWSDGSNLQRITTKNFWERSQPARAVMVQDADGQWYRLIPDDSIVGKSQLVHEAGDVYFESIGSNKLTWNRDDIPDSGGCDFSLIGLEECEGGNLSKAVRVSLDDLQELFGCSTVEAKDYLDFILGCRDGKQGKLTIDATVNGKFKPGIIWYGTDGRVIFSPAPTKSNGEVDEGFTPVTRGVSIAWEAVAGMTVLSSPVNIASIYAGTGTVDMESGGLVALDMPPYSGAFTTTQAGIPSNAKVMWLQGRTGKVSSSGGDTKACVKANSVEFLLCGSNVVPSDVSHNYCAWPAAINGGQITYEVAATASAGNGAFAHLRVIGYH